MRGPGGAWRQRGAPVNWRLSRLRQRRLLRWATSRSPTSVTPVKDRDRHSSAVSCPTDAMQASVALVSLHGQGRSSECRAQALHGRRGQHQRSFSPAPPEHCRLGFDLMSKRRSAVRLDSAIRPVSLTALQFSKLSS